MSETVKTEAMNEAAAVVAGNANWQNVQEPAGSELVRGLTPVERAVFDALVDVDTPSRTVEELRDHLRKKAKGYNKEVAQVTVTELRAALQTLAGLGILPHGERAITASFVIPHPLPYAFQIKGEADRYATAVCCRKTARRLLDGWAECYASNKAEFITKMTEHDYNVGYTAGWRLAELIRLEELAKIGVELEEALKRLVGTERHADKGEVLDESTWSFEGVMRNAAKQWIGQLMRQALEGHSTSDVSNLVERVRGEAFAKAIDEFRYVFTHAGVEAVSY